MFKGNRWVIVAGVPAAILAFLSSMLSDPIWTLITAITGYTVLAAVAIIAWAKAIRSNPALRPHAVGWLRRGTAVIILIYLVIVGIYILGYLHG